MITSNRSKPKAANGYEKVNTLVFRSFNDRACESKHRRAIQSSFFVQQVRT